MKGIGCFFFFYNSMKIRRNCLINLLLTNLLTSILNKKKLLYVWDMKKVAHDVRAE